MTSKMIQINYLPPKEKKTEHFISEGKMKVTIHSHFCNPIRKVIPISKVRITLVFLFMSEVSIN